MKSQLQDTALILVDIQNDFCPQGALAVNEGDQVVPIVNRLIPEFPLVISTQDWHPANHISFKERGGPWPPHCVQGTQGADLHPDLETETIAHYFRKASSPEKDDYSEFEGRDTEGRTLDDFLKSRGVTKLYVVGLATDYCVLETVLDGIKYGYDVYAVTDAMKAVNVNPDDGDKALQKMEQNGAHLLTSDGVLNLAGTSAKAP
ncbi:MAG: bifunctional nicotinamidase/pyrazinamidase [Acidobacteria bacterium]|nr:MAG: bifunctional nicotinamidase/pyrazinamidase [Acidobacteriota bacterium]